MSEDAPTKSAESSGTDFGGWNPSNKAEHRTSLLTAFQEIRELIVHGKMSPGTWIVEADLAERLNMSRTPVLGAIHWLQREGYVLNQRQVGKPCLNPRMDVLRTMYAAPSYF